MYFHSRVRPTVAISPGSRITGAITPYAPIQHILHTALIQGMPHGLGDTPSEKCRQALRTSAKIWARLTVSYDVRLHIAIGRLRNGRRDIGDKSSPVSIE